jgi:cytochrome P450/NADPH-cytochrome P450 reductase
VKVTLTMKPDGLKLKVRRRPGRTMESLGVGCITAPRTSQSRVNNGNDNTDAVITAMQLKPLTILYGSQAGTCKAYAEDLQTNAARYGFEADVATLDSATERVPKDQPVVIIEPSYEGKPADNAKKFVSWLQTNETARPLEGVQYAIFGVGNSDWATFYHLVPKLTDTLFSKMGATKFVDTGFVDVKSDVLGPWEAWAERMWVALRDTTGTRTAVVNEKLKAAISPPKFATHLGGSDIGYGIVRANKELGGKEVGLLKKHIDIELPPGLSYRSGDYMVVLPLNNLATVRRVLKRFDLSPDDNIAITDTSKAFLITEGPISVFDLLMTRVELGTPVSQKQLQSVADATPENRRETIVNLLDNDVYQKTVLPKRYSILDVLEDHPDCQLPFADYLDMLNPLKPRQYSISSSPISNIEFVSVAEKTIQRLTASLTYDVHDEPAWSKADRRFHGVASTYLARLDTGDRVRCFTRSTNINFHLPADPLTPVIMVCAGSGLAPMRGFIQERATIRKARNATLGPAILYFGCRDHEKDFIYKDELAQWESDGAVSVRACFSKEGPEGCFKYVPDRLWAERDEVAELFHAQGAKILVCGSASKLAKSTADVCKRIWLEKHEGMTEQDAQAWLDTVKETRYVSDVFQ